MSASRHNHKVLVSVFNAQEAREAVLGGGRIIDSEDPRTALGNIKPRQIMAVSDAVLNYKRNLDLQLSTNIGEDQLLFDRSETGQALEKSPYEIAGKSAQAALGVACSMGTRVHPCNLVKVGLDGMQLPMLEEILSECVLTLNRTEQFCHCQVMSVLFAQDLDLWDERKDHDAVRRGLVAVKEFFPSAKDFPGAFDITPYVINNVRDGEGNFLFTDVNQVDLPALIEKGVLPTGTKSTFVNLNSLFAHRAFGLTTDPKTRRTTTEVIRNMVDATARAGADAIMLDTSILMKTARVSLMRTDGQKGVFDFNQHDVDSSKLARRGILSVEEIRFFVEYCHFRGLEANIAGSFQSYHAQQIWRLVPELDQVSTRGGASARTLNPYTHGASDDGRHDRVIKRNLVRGMLPPEDDGVLNLPDRMKDLSAARADAAAFLQQTPGLEGYWVNDFGHPEPIVNS